MKKEVIIKNTKINYTLKRSGRMGSIKLAVCSNANVIVTASKFTSIRSVEKFLKEKINWLLYKIENSKNNINLVTDKNDYLCNKEKARLLVLEKINFFNKTYNVEYNKISIKNQKTVWGSCSSINNLNFNYKIIYLPDELANYIVVHELCHLKEMNHSKMFWNLVAILIPDHENIRKELKRYNLK